MTLVCALKTVSLLSRHFISTFVVLCGLSMKKQCDFQSPQINILRPSTTAISQLANSSRNVSEEIFRDCRRGIFYRSDARSHSI